MIIRRYKSDAAYQKDASKMASEGYKVLHVISERPRAGCLRIILTGGLGLLFGPKPQFIVTYAR